jgi:hypothetical protein
MEYKQFILKAFERQPGKWRASVQRANGLYVALPVGERELVAEQAVNELRALPDDPWKLSQELPRNRGVMADLGAPTPDGWSSPTDRTDG